MTMKVDWFPGCATALVTPFKSDGAIDERAPLLIEYHPPAACSWRACGTTGESATMTDEDP